ncbi:transcription/translation regulatory transformer protein RfaH [Pokkaliibacter sp. MBI-7]|uniref:transcription/translation regulatory transformer protein RfaH n=1 Tax=Pokkaliibacter sp. MBI-7 TaxID=3040600 RepID=UPI00244A35DB|nr:transcription/translation regulatory transformer protein RfaH [Pokkaliibacter sp. MBI-7]MDH2434243.1 transcription/translation regulatory transformer protein RfaH [Pokkaliibacter sp. MBI-7]
MEVAATRWYLIQCKPRESFRAELHLRNQGYECFHPTIKVEKARKNGPQWVTEPLFPHYLFISLNGIEDNWYPIRSTRGVSKMVTFNGTPLPVPDQIVSDLRSCMASGQKLSTPISFVEGERIRIVDGCFKELEALFTARSGEERVIVLLNILNRPQHICLPIQAITHL